MSINYKTDIDYELLSKNLTDAEIASYIKSNFYKEGRSKKDFMAMFKFLKLVHRLNGIQPSSEQLVYILNNKKRVLCEACAGAGKTTMSYYRMIMFNAFYNIKSDKMLSLCYNKHASDKVENEYADIARSINTAIGSSGYIGTKIHAYTVHAWCKVWVEEYLSKFKLTRLNIADESEQLKLVSSELQRFNKKRDNPINYSDSTVSSMLQLYNFACETLTQEQPEAWYYRFDELHQYKAHELVQIMANLDKYKKLVKKVDYNDLLKYMYELVCDPEIVKRIRSNYQFIMVDEWQDITPAISRIIEKLVNGSEELGIPPYPECYLTVIGDGDQSIYGFRGTDSDNCIKFRDNYTLTGYEDEVCVTSMSINRRCKSVILDKARDVITSLSRRIQKPLNCIHEGGNIETYEYVTEADEIDKVIALLEKHKDELYDTCICYRNTSSSSYISTILMDRHIPFRVVRGLQPFADLYTTTLNDLLNMLSNPKIPEYAKKVLYKVLPKGKGFTREYLNKEIDKYIEERKKASRDYYVEEKNFWEFDFTPGENQRGFAEAIELLKKASAQCMSGKAMFVYMPSMIQLVSLYYLNSIYKLFYKDKISDEYIEYVKRYYSCNLSYIEFREKYKKDLEFIKENESTGVYLTTMHGLKGLEFKNVIVLDLHDRIFPGTDLKNVGMSEDELEKAENEARRLFYVTVTRAKDNLYLMFNKNQPSRYIRYFVEEEHLAQLYKQQQTNVEDTPFMSSKEYAASVNNSGTVDSNVKDKAPMSNLGGTDFDSSGFILTEDLTETQSIVIERNLDVKITQSAPLNENNVKTYDRLPSNEPFKNDFDIAEVDFDFDSDTDLDFDTGSSDALDFDTGSSDTLNFDTEGTSNSDSNLGLDFDVDSDGISDFDADPVSTTSLFDEEEPVKEKPTAYDDIRATKPRLASILDILTNK